VPDPPSQILSTAIVGSWDTPSRSVHGKHLGQPEVEHLDGAVGRDLDVRRLQIAVDDALVVRGLERVRDLERQPERLWNRQRARHQPLRERRALDELEDEARTPSVSSYHRSRRCVTVQCRSPRLAFEAREPFRVRKEGVGHDLDGDVAAELGVPGAIHLAHPTFAEDGQDLVRTDLPAHERRSVLSGQDVRRHFSDRGLEKTLRPLRMRQQCLDLRSQRIVRSAGRRHERGPLARIPVERSVAQLLDSPPALGVRHRPSPSSSRSSQSFASRQSRLTCRAKHRAPRPSPPRSGLRRSAAR
jgi:hypothetical protein